MRRLFIFISLHLFLFLLVIAYQAQADEDEWEVRTFQDMIIASVPGEIVHGDKLRFILKKGNCRSLNVLFSFLTFNVPNEITPFSVLGLLRKIHEEKDFPEDIQLQLNESIASVEKQYFDREDERSLNLKNIAEEWVNRAV